LTTFAARAWYDLVATITSAVRTERQADWSCGGTRIVYVGGWHIGKAAKLSLAYQAVTWIVAIVCWNTDLENQINRNNKLTTISVNGNMKQI
jgi:hypothetical protein